MTRGQLRMAVNCTGASAGGQLPGCLVYIIYVKRYFERIKDDAPFTLVPKKGRSAGITANLELSLPSACDDR